MILELRRQLEFVPPEMPAELQGSVPPEWAAKLADLDKVLKIFKVKKSDGSLVVPTAKNFRPSSEAVLQTLKDCSVKAKERGPCFGDKQVKGDKANTKKPPKEKQEVMLPSSQVLGDDSFTKLDVLDTGVSDIAIYASTTRGVFFVNASDELYVWRKRQAREINPEP